MIDKNIILDSAIEKIKGFKLPMIQETSIIENLKRSKVYTFEIQYRHNGEIKKFFVPATTFSEAETIFKYLYPDMYLFGSYATIKK